MSEKTVPAKRENEVPVTREEKRYLKPTVDIFENEEALVVICDMPGVEKETIDVDVNNSILTIKGSSNHPDSGDAVYKEFSLLNFYRQFELGEEVAQEQIEAELKNGVLTLTLPKIEKPKPRRISVKVA